MSWVWPPPLGVPQRGYDMLKDQVGPHEDHSGRLDMYHHQGQVAVVHVDGVVITRERGSDGHPFWVPESDEHLCIPELARLARIGAL